MNDMRRRSDVISDRRGVRCVVIAGAVAASAFLMALAIASPSYWWLGWVTLLPLFLAIRVFTPLGASLCGGLWGGALFASAVALFDTPIQGDLLSFLLLCLIPASYAFVGARLTGRVGFSPLVLAFGWIGVELALAPLGLRHGLLAGTQGDGVVVRVVGSFTGYALVAFLVAYVNASLLSVLSCVRLGSRGVRPLRGSGDGLRPFFPLDVIRDLTSLLRRLQPRAPPLAG
jgi:apolipoprotein N-acyltransferase